MRQTLLPVLATLALVIAWVVIDGRIDQLGASPAVQVLEETGGPVEERATRLFLGPNDRYRVTVDFRDFDGNSGRADFVEGTPSQDAGLFWFFDDQNWEVLVKVLDGCGINDRTWVFIAGTTNVQYEVRVRDRETGQVATYFNPLGVRSPAFTDNNAFANCASLATQPPESLKSGDTGDSNAGAVETGVQERIFDPTTMLLDNNRFRVTVNWQTFGNDIGPGRVVPFGAEDSGLFYFFDPDNWEMLVKVLDGCGINDHYWVFAASATDLQFTMVVADLQTGQARTFQKTSFSPAPAIIDVNALPCDSGVSTTTSISTTTTTSPTTTTIPSSTTTTVGTTSTTTTVPTSTTTTTAGSSTTTSVATTTSSSSTTTSIASTTSTSSSTTTTSVGATVSFAADVHPLFTNDGCIGCHTSAHDCDGGGAGTGGLNLTGSPSTVWNRLRGATPNGCESPWVSTGNPTSSLILRKPIGQLSHGGGSPWSQGNASYNTVLTWIQEGALNN